MIGGGVAREDSTPIFQERRFIMARIQILADKKAEVYKKVRESLLTVIPPHYLPLTVEDREVVYADGTRQKLGAFTQLIGGFFKFDPANDSKKFRDGLTIGASYDADALTDLIVDAKVKFLLPDKARMVPFKEHTTKIDRDRLSKYDNGTAITDTHKVQRRGWFGLRK